MAKSAAKPLAASIAAGWEDFQGGTPGPLAYYLHKGRVYLCGALQSLSDGTTTTTLLTGLPAVARPTADVHLTLRLLPWTFLANKALDFLTTTLAATVHTSDGSITLDAALPAWVNAPPDPAVWWMVTNDSNATHHALYPNPLDLVLVLGGHGWDGPSGALADAPPMASLASHLDTAFTDIDSTYAVHGTRVHLGGSVRANTDGPSRLLASLPLRAGDGLDPSEGHDTDIGGLPCTATSPFGGAVGLNTETILPPSGHSPYLSPSSPPSSFGFGSHNYNSISGSGSGPPPGITWPGDGPDIDHPLVTNHVETSEGYGEKWVHQQFNESVYTCPQYDTGIPDGLEYGCRKPGSPAMSLSFTVAEMIALCAPEPDWFLLLVEFGWRGWGPSVAPNLNANDGTCLVATPLGISGGCGPGITSLISVGGATFYNPDGSAATPPSWDTAHDNSGGFPSGTNSLFLKPPVSHYVGYPSSAGATWWDTSLLWRNDQTGSFTLATALSGFLNAIDWSLGVDILPYYEMRGDGVRSGDMIDFDGSGWEGILPGNWVSVIGE